MEMHRIGIISDTHGLLRPEAEVILRSCEVILHGGDIDRPEILEKLREIAPVYAVLGNADRLLNDLENTDHADMAEATRKSAAAGGKEQPERKADAGELPGERKAGAGELPRERELELFGFRFYMIHNRKHARKDLRGIDAVIYGHSHKYEDFLDGEGGLRYLNPGSCGPKRFRLPVTMMLLTLYPAGHRMEAERIDLQESAPSAAGESAEHADELSEQDLYRLVKKVMKGVKAGKSVAELAVRNQADEKLVADICRMYVTHPGVDADGIMDRLERRGL